MTLTPWLHYDADGLPVLDAAPDTPYRRRLVRLAFLAPEIQRAIVEGRQAPALTLARLLKGPIALDCRGRPRAPDGGITGVGTGSYPRRFGSPFRPNSPFHRRPQRPRAGEGRERAGIPPHSGASKSD